MGFERITSDIFTCALCCNRSNAWPLAIAAYSRRCVCKIFPFVILKFKIIVALILGVEAEVMDGDCTDIDQLPRPVNDNGDFARDSVLLVGSHDTVKVQISPKLCTCL